jgi:enterochelin esterase family protein
MNHLSIVLRPLLALGALISGLVGTPVAAAQAPSFDSILEERWHRTPVSPRIEELLRAVRNGDHEAAPRFWSALAANGAPLIESDQTDSTMALVTFVWRSPNTVRVVAMVDFGQSALRMLLQRATGTDVWFRTYRLPNDARFLYTFAVDDTNFPFEFGDSTAWPTATRTDPLNPKTWGSPPQLSLVELPRAPTLPWGIADPAQSRGTVGRYGGPIESAILRNARNGFIYKPAGYADSKGPYPLLIFGASFISQIRLPAILDYLIATGRIPPVVAAFFDWPPGRQDLESGCMPEFGDFLASEFLPWVRSRVRVTTDPTRVVIGGASAGGFSAACVALRHPEAFGNVISQSGAFWRGYGHTAAYWADPNRNDADRVWFAREVASMPRVPVRFFVTIGTLERGGSLGEGGISMIHVTRQVRDVLIARRYDVTYREISGGHDPYNWEIALPGALEKLLNSKRSPTR